MTKSRWYFRHLKRLEFWGQATKERDPIKYEIYKERYRKLNLRARRECMVHSTKVVDVYTMKEGV